MKRTPKPRLTLYRAVAVWPAALQMHNEANESITTHETRAQAEAECRTLEREGFACRGEVFPVSVRVERAKR